MGGSSTASREIFAGMSSAEIALWYVLSVISTLIFFVGVGILVRRYRQNKRGLGRQRRGWKETTRIVASHAWIRRGSGVTGLAHAGVFYGFVVLFIGTTILSFDDHIARPLGFGFWHGWFYEGYSIVPRRLWCRLGRRLFDLRLSPRREPAVAAWIRTGRRRGRVGAAAVSDRRLGVPLDPPVPRRHRLHPRITADRDHTTVVRSLVAGRLGRRQQLPRPRTFAVGRSGDGARPVVDSRTHGTCVRLSDPVHQGRPHHHGPDGNRHRRSGGGKPPAADRVGLGAGLRNDPRFRPRASP